MNSIVFRFLASNPRFTGYYVLHDSFGGSSMRKALLPLLLLVLFAPLAQAAETWVIDKTHSDVTFKVRHFVANAKGRFTDFTGTIVKDDSDPKNSSVVFAIKTASIDTDDKRRDDHLRSADFFDAEKHPEISFRSTEVKPLGKNQYSVTGQLTMHGITKEVVLPVTFLGSLQHPSGAVKGGFSTEVTLNRKDYGITWNRALDEGSFVLGEDVSIEINLEVDQKK